MTTNFSSRAFFVSASLTCNSLPAPIRSLDKLSTFKRQLKSHLFQSAFVIYSLCASALDSFLRFWCYINLYVCMYVYVYIYSPSILPPRVLVLDIRIPKLHYRAGHIVLRYLPSARIAYDTIAATSLPPTATNCDPLVFIS